MWLVLLLSLAHAAPDSPFPREGQTVRVQRYARIVGDGPYWPKYRNNSGAYEVWTWPDLMVARYRRYQGRVVVEERLFDAVGEPLSTIAYEEGAPQTVTVHGRTDAIVDVRGWEPYAHDPVTLRLPGEPVDGAWRIGEGVFRIETAPASDVWSDAFRDGLLETCGCVLLDRTRTLVDGVPAARYLLRLPDPDQPLLGEVWAVPLRNGTLLASWLAPAGDEPPGIDDVAVRLATGRAILSLVRIEKSR